MDNEEILALYDREMRIEIEYPGMIKEVNADIVRFFRPGPGMSFVHFSRLTSANADERIAEQVERFRSWDGPCSWDLYSHDQPPDLLARLIAHDFEPEETPGAVMVLDLQEAPAEIFQSANVSLRRIEHREQLAEVARILAAVWNENFDWVEPRLGENLEIPGYLSVYTAEMNGLPAACAWIYFYPNSHFAGLYGGATLTEHRGKGLYTALLAARAREARQRGYRFLTIDAGDMSRPIAVRRGFRQISTVTTCTWKGK